MPTQMLTSLGAASAADRLTVVMTRQRTSQYPPRERSRDDDFAPVHPADGPHLHAGGQRQPVRAHPRRRGRPPGGPGHDASGTVKDAYSSGRLPGDVDATASATVDGNPATAWQPGPRQQGSGGLHAHLRPGHAPDPDRARHAGHRRRASFGPDGHDDHVGHARRARSPCRRSPTARCRARSRPCRSPSLPSPARISWSPSPACAPSTRRTTTRPGRWSSRWASPKSASPAQRRTRRRRHLPGNCVSNLLTIDGQPISVSVVGPTQSALDGGEAQLVPCGPDAKGITAQRRAARGADGGRSQPSVRQHTHHLHGVEHRPARPRLGARRRRRIGCLPDRGRHAAAARRPNPGPPPR